MDDVVLIDIPEYVQKRWQLKAYVRVNIDAAVYV